MDYPDFARSVGQAVLRGFAELGVLVCGSSVGASIAANKLRGIRAALCGETFTARQSREDDDANVLCLGARVLDEARAIEIARAWLAARFSADRLSGLALGGLALGGGQKSPQGVGKGLCAIGRCYPTSYKTDAYTYGQLLPEFDPLTPIEPDEMRITFLGSAIPPNYRAQEMMSIFVQVGNAKGQPDQAIFDCGSGVCANYGAMGIGFGRMDKIFLNHLHGDHMSDISYIYQAGPQADRKTPLFVFGPGPTDFVWTAPDGSRYGPYDDRTIGRRFPQRLNRVRWIWNQTLH